MTITVIKVGGSLFDLPDLGDRLQAVLSQFPDDQILLIAGGGPAADTVRHLQKLHRFSDQVAHRMAMDSLRVGEGLLGALLPNATLVLSWEHLEPPEPIENTIGIVQSASFVAHRPPNARESREDWTFTSDSIAAWVASVVQADRLLMLKSVPPPTSSDSDAVDDAFHDYIGNLEVLWCNLRKGTRFETLSRSVQ